MADKPGFKQVSDSVDKSTGEVKASQIGKKTDVLPETKKPA